MHTTRNLQIFYHYHLLKSKYYTTAQQAKINPTNPKSRVTNKIARKSNRTQTDIESKPIFHRHLQSHTDMPMPIQSMALNGIVWHTSPVGRDVWRVGSCQPQWDMLLYGHINLVAACWSDRNFLNYLNEDMFSLWLSTHRELVLWYCVYWNNENFIVIKKMIWHLKLV